MEVQLTTPGSKEDKTPGAAFSARVEKDGRFTVRGITGQGIPPGSYTFVLRFQSSRPTGGKAPPSFLQGLSEAATSPLKYEVTDDSKQRVVIDLAKRTVQREP